MLEGSGRKAGRHEVRDVSMCMSMSSIAIHASGLLFCIRALLSSASRHSTLKSPPPGFWHNALRGQMRANPCSRPPPSPVRPPCLSISPPLSSIRSSTGGQTNIFAACFLRANWILKWSSVAGPLPAEQREAAQSACGRSIDCAL